MARQPIKKILENSRLLKDYASWIYCNNCNKTVAYLCYVTYDFFDFKYICRCGNKGKVCIEFEHNKPESSDKQLITIKNRLCCSEDNVPLLTIVGKNLKDYNCNVVCNKCNTNYNLIKE